MTTPNIEELIVDVQKQLAHHKHHSFFERDWRVADNLKALLDCIDSMNVEVERLTLDRNQQAALVEKCILAMNENADRGQAAEKERDTLRAQLAALQVDDELPESPYVVDALRRIWTRVGFATPNDGENLFTADQVRQAQAKVRAKMVPLENDAERKPLTDAQIEEGRKAIFSTGNPFCPCDSGTMRKVVQWTQRKHGITGEPK